MRKIKFGELVISDIAKKHINECLDSNHITMGKKVLLFENKWKDLFGYKYTRFMSSGTTAGTASCISLHGLGMRQGDEILCPALSFIATANAIRMANFIPKFIDVDRKTLNINEDLIEQNITSKTKAIKVVNTMGRPCKLDLINDIAKKYGLFVIVDGCESYGCKYKGKYSLDYADIETSSHYIAHCVVSGEGGCASTNNPDIDVLLESARSHGRHGGSLYFNHIDFGGNFKNTDLHASIGLGELEVFWDNFDIRHKNMMRLHDGLKYYKDNYFWASEQDFDCINCPHGFSITVKDARFNIDGLKLHLEKAGIESKRNFGCIPTQHRAFEYLGYNFGSYPEAEYIGSNGLHIGVHRYLTNNDLDYIIDVVSNYFDSI